jgi:hypothetical protein
MRNKILYSVFVMVVVSLAVAPAVVFGQSDERAAQVLAMSRKAIGDKKLDALRSLSLDAVLQRNINTMQMSSDVELLFELPDKYLRTDQPNSPGMVVSGMSSGFNGERPIQPVTGSPGGGAFVIRMGPGGPAAPPAEKLSPEEQEKLEQSIVRNAKQELSRLMLGWFATAHPSVNAQYTFAGEAESPDGRAFVIDVTNADGFAARLFIDQQTKLPLMVTYQGPQRQVMAAGGPGRVPGGAAAHGGTVVQQSTPGRPATEEARKKMQEDAEKRIEEMRKQPPVIVDYTLFFDDWQPVDGVQFPRKIRRATGGTTTEEWTIGKVKINPQIDPKKFAVKS